MFICVTASRCKEIPEADVVCYGLWVDPALATRHGVFVSDRKSPDQLDFMLQKPTLDELGRLAGTYLFLMDLGVWLLSDPGGGTPDEAFLRIGWKTDEGI